MLSSRKVLVLDDPQFTSLCPSLSPCPCSSVVFKDLRLEDKDLRFKDKDKDLKSKDKDLRFKDKDKDLNSKDKDL